ncbi:DUF2125 domain-containing protein [Notoacmeibacter sp. MSK16QG-6]|uniref:DUF2125 domain-containing protein n=1 Tax=Notoacmeibacter sp. MSK16QG-6 TaxID=2957982 RepID=UPI0020A0DF45|nr:DUF2125 domain-containing protein [Notoacmeibacter sp. MSK16QG-6]MCP1199987.1 DUF2125 domain-containing protein [Notoacmeibacter sp. MSK16QG-6]
MTRRLATHPDDRQSRFRFGALALWVATAILLILIAWTAGWFYMASRLEEQTRTILTQIEASGAEASCGDLTTTGYPFQLGVACDTVSFGTADGQYTATAPGLVSTAEIRKPERIGGRLGSPLTLEGPDFPPLTLRWDDLRFSTDYDEPLPQRAALRVDDVKLFQEESQTPFAEASQLHLTWRLHQSDLDLNLQLSDFFAAVPTAVRLPPLTLIAKASVADGAQKLAGGGLRTMRGLSGTLSELRLHTADGDAEIQISGDYVVGDDGLIDGDVHVRIESPERLGDIIAELAPDEADTIRSAFKTLAGFTVDGKTPSIPVRIKDGVPSVLFIKLPRIPPLP